MKGSKGSTKERKNNRIRLYEYKVKKTMCGLRCPCLVIYFMKLYDGKDTTTHKEKIPLLKSCVYAMKI